MSAPRPRTCAPSLPAGGAGVPPAPLCVAWKPAANQCLGINEEQRVLEPSLLSLSRLPQSLLLFPCKRPLVGQAGTDGRAGHPCPGDSSSVLTFWRPFSLIAGLLLRPPSTAPSRPWRPVTIKKLRSSQGCSEAQCSWFVNTYTHTHKSKRFCFRKQPDLTNDPHFYTATRALRMG